MKHPHRWAALTLIPALLAGAGCAGGDGTEPETTGSPTAGAAFPVTVGTGEAAVEIDTRPERIVSLSPTATESLFAIGAGEQVIAADEHSDFPEEAPTTDLSGFQPNVEAILGHEPDLVVAQNDPGELVSGLAQVDVPTLLQPSAQTLSDAFTQITQLGAATGRTAEAGALVTEMQQDVDAVVAEVPERSEPLTYYHELDPNFYSVTSSTFVGELYGMLGMQSIADGAGGESGGYPQLSPEFVIDADPDVILLADAECCDVDAAAVTARPGWDELTAVQQDRIIELDEDLASRWGPRVVDFLENLVPELAALGPIG